MKLRDVLQGLTVLPAGLTGDEGSFTATAREDRFNAQIARFLSLSWQTTP